MYLIVVLSLGIYYATTFITHRSETIGVKITMGKYNWRLTAVVFSTVGIILAEQRSGHLNWTILQGLRCDIYYIILLGFIIFWKYFTTDFDLGFQKHEIFYRISLLISFCLCCFNFAFLLIFIFIAIQFLDGWEHHTMLILRTLKLNYSFCVVLIILSLFGISPNIYIISRAFFFLNLLLISSHYFRPGVDKIILGKSLTAWVAKNNTHHLIISAYNWGWGRFISEDHVISFTKLIAPFVPLINFLVVIFELSPILLLSIHGYFIIVFICLVAMQLSIFILTGINFWENIVTLLIATYIFNYQYYHYLINWTIADSLIYMTMLILTNFVIKVWSTWQLAWWDTPFAGRVNWYLTGYSGKKYRLSNRFMCPHERLYGHLHGYFLVKYGIIHGHPPGAVYNIDLKNKILATKGQIDQLRALQKTVGKCHYSIESTAEHLSYLKTFFNNYNLGKRKNILPQILRWLKAPGGQFFYWGDYPEFRSQEKIQNIEIYYQEYFFTGKENLCLTQEKLQIIEISSEG